ncbi:MAG: hypothetical protein ABJO29_11310 [Yoonia sp.]|uniref:hypothetical protein n=1 Tax=Yoonia sp. TaxID=2212373 RepID=UPI003266A64A
MPANAAVHAIPLPADALLQRYTADPKNYTDCYVKDIAGHVSLSDFITAFYTTPLFRAERLILKYAVRRPSTDEDVHAVAHGDTQEFAAWTVEDRTEDQVLLCDMAGHTRSWFMVSPIDGGTRLHFGSAVTPGDGVVVRAITPLHKLYARSLLRGANPAQSAAIMQ